MLETRDGMFLCILVLKRLLRMFLGRGGEAIRTEDRCKNQGRHEFRERVFLRLYALLLSHILRGVVGENAEYGRPRENSFPFPFWD